MVSGEHSKNEKVEVAKSSVAASLFLTVSKTVVGLTTGSLGILSEAAHSALDLFAALITYFAVKVSDKPADEEHHYGHAKIENFSAFVESLLLLLTCGWIIKEALDRLFFEHVPVEINFWSYAIIIISIIIDYSRAKALSRVAKSHNSQALEADALHFYSDIFSSLVVLGGLIFARFGIIVADSLAALAVAVIVMIASIKLARKTIDALLDKAPIGLDKDIEEEILKMPGVVGVHKVRLRQSGGCIQGDLHVVMDRSVSFVHGHKIATQVEERLTKYSSDIVIHFEPEEDGEESARKIEETKKLVAKIMDDCGSEYVQYHELNVKVGSNSTSVAMHIVLPKETSVVDARAKCDFIEKKIKDQIREADVQFYMEPCAIDCTECNDSIRVNCLEHDELEEK